MRRVSKLLERNRVPGRLIVGLILAGPMIISSGRAQTSGVPDTPLRSASARPPPDRFAGRAAKYYALIWGVDELSVKSAESGELVRFSYRVIDPQKAKVLNDKKFEPALIFPDAGIKLVIPSLEKVVSCGKATRRKRANLTGWHSPIPAGRSSAETASTWSSASFTPMGFLSINRMRKSGGECSVLLLYRSSGGGVPEVDSGLSKRRESAIR